MTKITKTGTIQELIQDIQESTDNDLMLPIPGQCIGSFTIEKTRALDDLDRITNLIDKTCHWELRTDEFNNYIKLLSIDYAE